MKKLSCILLAVMLITAMFVSCTAEVIDPYDGLAYVTFGGPASKDLSASYEVQSYEKLYWFYTAKKADAFGKTGEVTVKTPVSKDGEAGLGGQVGPFSQGLWDFELFAYSSKGREEGTLVYKGSVEKVELTSSNLTSVPVSVTPQGENGTIKFNNAYFKWAGASGEGKPTIKITAEGPVKYTLRSDLLEDDPAARTFILKVGDKADDKLSLNQEYSRVSAGYYKCTVVAWVVDEKNPIFTQEFGIRVYGSATTVISGDITEKVDSFVDFEAKSDLNVFQGTDSVIFDSTPSNVPGLLTTVDFTGLDTSKQYSLNISVSDAVSSSGKFEVSDSNKVAIAAIDFQLKQVGSEGIVEFSEAVISTYITAGLEKDSVEVHYNGDEEDPTFVSYDSNTGKLVFKTTHFSEYYVVANKVAEANGKYYGSLQDAIDAATDGDKIIVQKDIQWTKKIEISGKRKLTIDLNGHSIVGDDGDKSCLFDIYDAEVLFTGKGVISDTAVCGYAPIGVKGNSEDCSNYTVVTIDSEVVIKGFYGIMVTKDSKGRYNNYGLVVNVKGTIEVPLATCPVEQHPEYGGAAIYINGSNTQTEGNVISINLEGATLNVDKGIGIYAAGYAKWNIKDTTINGADAAIEIRAGKMVIESGKFTASTTPTEVTPNGNGSTTSGSALAVAQHTTKLPVLVNIAGGTFEGYSALYESNSQGNSSEAIAKVRLSVADGTFNAINGGSVAVYSQNCKKFITGGTFNSNPAEYLVDNYGSDLTDGKYVVRDRGTDEAMIDGVLYKTLNDAVDAVPENTPTTIQILANRVEFSDSTNKVITFKGKGANETTLKLSSNQPGAHGCSLSFEDLELEMLEINAHYAGFGHASSLNFTNCVISGRGSLWGGGSVVFKDCVFNNTGDYNLWLYKGKSFVFENCNFESSVGKFINAYKENGQPASTVTITDCKFVSTKDSTEESENKYAVVYIKETSEWDVSINNMHIEGNVETGARSGSQCYEVKSGAKKGTVVSIDGNVVWKDDAPIEKTN